MSKKIPALALAATLGGAAVPAQAAIDPLAIVLTVQQVTQMQRQVMKQFSRVRDQVKKRLSGHRELPPPDIAPVLERMRSPFEEDRAKAAAEMEEIAAKYAEDPEKIPQLDRVEVLLGQLLRDGHWKTRHKAYRSLVKLGLMDEIEDKSERFKVIFPVKTASRAPLGPQVASAPGQAGTGAAKGKDEIDLLYDFLAVMKTRKPKARTRLAAVLDDLIDGGILEAPKGKQLDAPAAGKDAAKGPLEGVMGGMSGLF